MLVCFEKIHIFKFVFVGVIGFELGFAYFVKKFFILGIFAGSMYHGSPLLLSVLGPLTVRK